MRKLLLGLIFALFATAASAQTCPTRPVGDNTNACATTAFVNSEIASFEVTCTVIEKFGGAGNGTTDNTAAFSAWKTSIGSGDGCLYFGVGTYKFSSNAIGATLAAGQNITLQGLGQETTKILFSGAGDGFSFTYTTPTPSIITGSALQVRNMDILTAQAGTGVGLKLNGNSTVSNPMKVTVWENLNFRGSVNSAYWSVGAQITDTQTAIVQNTNCYGSINSQATTVFVAECIKIIGSSAATLPTQFTLANISAFWMGVGIHGVGYIQGIEISNAQLTGMVIGVECDGTAGLSQSQCSVVNSQINANQYGILMNDMGASQSAITGNLIFIGDSSTAGAVAAISALSSPWLSITGNTMQAITTSGSFEALVILGSNTSYGVVANNVFMNAPLNVNLRAGSNNNLIGDNKNFNGTIDVTDLGSSNLVRVNSGTTETQTGSNKTYKFASNTEVSPLTARNSGAGAVTTKSVAINLDGTATTGTTQKTGSQLASVPADQDWAGASAVIRARSADILSDVITAAPGSGGVKLNSYTSAGLLLNSGVGVLSSLSGASVGTIPLSNGTNWIVSGTTWPNSSTINQLLYSSATNTIGGLATANSGVLVTSSGGVPSISSTLPSFGIGAAALGNAYIRLLGPGTGTNYGIFYTDSGSNIVLGAQDNGSIQMTKLPTSAGTGGLFLCVDTSGVIYKKATCP